MATSQRNTHFCGAKVRTFPLSAKHLRHYFQKLFDFEHFAFQGATLVNRQNVLLSTYSVAESSLQLPYFRFPQRVSIHPVVFYIRDSKIFIGGIFLD